MAVLDIEFGTDYVNYEVKDLNGSYVDHASVDLYLGQTVIQNHWYEPSEVAGHTSFSGTFTGLSPNTTYTIWEYVWDSAGTLVSRLSKTFTTQAQTFTIRATVTFDANGGTVYPSSATGEAQVQAYEGNVSVLFPTPSKQGYNFDHWELRYGSTIYQTPYYPGYNSIYATTSWPQYTAKAIWTAQVTPGAYIHAGGTWKKATPYIYATKNGVKKWWPATEKIYSNGGWQ